MASPAPARRRVLVVDDDPQLANILTLYLGVQDLEVTIAGNGQEALDALGGGLPDLVITDVMMPVMDGITLCRRLRALSGAETLPIIVFTALDAESDLEAARQAGADEVITKPFDLPGLGDVVSGLLHRAARAAA